MSKLAKLKGITPKYVFGRVRHEIRKNNNDKIIKKNKPLLHNKDVSIISQNCVGGVFYHDMGLQFLSPTVNLYLTSNEFLKYVINIKKYNDIVPVVTMDDEKKYPVGKLGDLTLNFMHYHTCDEALQKWEDRKKRINYDNLFVMVIDDKYFTEDSYKEFEKISYDKILFTTDKVYAGKPDCLVLDKIFENGKSLIIEHRKFYKNKVLINKLNAMK